MFRVTEILFQHSDMGQKRRIVEIFGAARTVSYTGLALDTDSRYIRYVLQVNRAHRTAADADAALRAF